MKVFVIVVNYSGKAFIGECIDSVLASNYKDFEIIIVDNASTDKSLIYLRKKYAKNKKVKIIYSKKQLYFTGGSNLGAKKANGDLLFFLNSDTIIDKNCISEMVSFINSHTNYLVQPKVLWENNPAIIDNIGGRYNFFGFGFAVGRGEKDEGQHDENREFDYVNGTAFMINYDFFWQLGGFDERFRYFYEDVDLSLQARRIGGECWSCTKAIVYHKGSLTFKKTMSDKEIKQCIRKNRHLLRIKRLNQSLKTIVNKLRFWELKKAIGKKRFSLLDLGCGTGDFAALAASEGIKTLAIDKKLPFSTTLHRTVENLTLKESKIENFNLKRRFNVVTMYHVLEHVDNPKKTLKKAKKWLKPNGILVIESPLVGNLTERFLGKNYFAYYDKTHKHFYTKENLLDLIGKTGFKVIKKGITYYEFPITVITAGFRKGLWYGFAGILLFLPLKLLTFLGLNDEIVRFYCVKD
jgi:GT2 family glycosyltransferase